MNFCMDLKRRTGSYGIAACIVSVAAVLLSADVVEASSYTVEDLTPTGFQWARIYDGTDDLLVGQGKGVDGKTYPLLWDLVNNQMVSLHNPAYRTLSVYATDGQQHVGDASYPLGAVLWNGDADHMVDLHPAEFTHSYVFGVNDGQQVGYGSLYVEGGDPYHPLLWHGTAESVVNLRPDGYRSSFANDVDDGIQVGEGILLEGSRRKHALMWRGSAESVVDIHPLGYSTSRALRIQGDYIMGTGESDLPRQTRALVWTISTGAVNDLHPDGFKKSYVYARRNGKFVGSGELESASPHLSRPHALLWLDTSNQVVDLNQYLPEPFVAADALSIDSQGNVYGNAFDEDNRIYPIVWRAASVPEPTLGCLFLCASASWLCLGRHRPG